MTRSVIRCAILSAAALTAVVGCGGPGGGKNAVVSGKVTYGGKVLPGGNITFTPNGDPTKARTGSIDPSTGAYSITDLARGECKVSVENASLKSIPASVKGTEMPGMTKEQAKYVPIDVKYAKPETSGLSTNIDKATATYDVDLK